jgi:sulfur transfer protein SufE
MTRVLDQARREAPDVPAPLTALMAELDGLDRAGRIEQLVHWADEFAQVPPEVARPPFPEASRAARCESEAYVFARDRPDGTLGFHFAVESPHALSARAWAVILARTCSGQPLEQVARVSEEAIYGVFGRELSMGKEQGLLGMLDLVTRAARTRLAARRVLGTVEPK